jgi:epoxyqueuosine reductase
MIEKAKSFGASLAGVAPLASLLESPSHKGFIEFAFPAEAKSVLVLALTHKASEPELDWWDNKEGGTSGNRQLMNTAAKLKKWLRKECNLDARTLPYRPEERGVFLKDAAALAGLGTVGKNNLVVTAEFGPRVRFLAMLLDTALAAAAPSDASPCAACDMPCRRICPQKAFESGSYSRSSCSEQMRQDEAKKMILEGSGDTGSPRTCIKYCRACELACPVGQ